MTVVLLREVLLDGSGFNFFALARESFGSCQWRGMNAGALRTYIQTNEFWRRATSNQLSYSGANPGSAILLNQPGDRLQRFPNPARPICPESRPRAAAPNGLVGI